MPSTPKGKYRHRVTLVKISLGTADTTGEQPKEETVLGTVWAEIKPLSGREVPDGSMQISEATHKIEFLFGSEWSSLNAHDRIDFGSQQFEIVDLRNYLIRNQAIGCICKELVK